MESRSINTQKKERGQYPAIANFASVCLTSSYKIKQAKKSLLTAQDSDDCYFFYHLNMF